MSAPTKQKPRRFYEHAAELDRTRRMGRSIGFAGRGLMASMTREQE